MGLSEELMFTNPPISNTDLTSWRDVRDSGGAGGRYLSDQNQQLSVVQKHLKAEML